MRQKYLNSLGWVIKLQWQTSQLSLVWSIFNSTLNGLQPIISTFILAKLITSVSAAALQNGPARTVYLWLLATLILEVVIQLISSLNRIMSTRFEQKIDLAIEEQFFLKMYDLSQQQFDDETFNTKLERARDSLHQIRRVFEQISNVGSVLIGFIGAIIAILVVAPVVGVIIIITVIPVVILEIKQNRNRDLIYKKIEPLERVAYRSRWMLLDPNFMPEIRLVNGFKTLIHSWHFNMKKSQDMLYENDKAMMKYDTVTELVQPLVGFGANIYFFHLLLDGTIGLDRFIFLRGMLEQASASARSLAFSLKSAHQLLIDLGNFSEVFETPPAINNGTGIVDRPLTIEFKNVSFAYPGTTQLVLEDVSFVIAPGSKLAIVGENGAGKTTLLKLLLRQYLPTSGHITINGINIADVEQENYYAAISNLSQDFLVVNHLSIADNLTLGLARKPSEKEIYTTTDLVSATDFIRRLPHKLDSRLDNSFDDGTTLSGGQLQRLGVARALLRQGDLMILDEPTSAIDAKAEYTIFNGIYSAHEGKTTLIVSHRFSTVRKADHILVMEQGKIIQQGSHESLLKQGGLYKEMFDAQAEGYK